VLLIVTCNRIIDLENRKCRRDLLAQHHVQNTVENRCVADEQSELDIGAALLLRGVHHHGCVQLYPFALAALPSRLIVMILDRNRGDAHQWDTDGLQEPLFVEVINEAVQRQPRGNIQ
jgi:hypothetical protein